MDTILMCDPIVNLYGKVITQFQLKALQRVNLKLTSVYLLLLALTATKYQLISFCLLGLKLEINFKNYFISKSLFTFHWRHLQINLVCYHQIFHQLL